MKEELQKAYELRNVAEKNSSHYLNAFSLLGLMGIFKLLERENNNYDIYDIYILKISFLFFTLSLLLNLISWFVSVKSIDEYISVLNEKTKKQSKSEWPRNIILFALSFSLIGLILLLISFWTKF